MSNTRQDIDAIKLAAKGRWLEILPRLSGLELSCLDGKHHPCPKCGGKDRFRMIDEDAGALLCNRCFLSGNGDGIAALGWLNGWEFSTTLREVASYLGVEIDLALAWLKHNDQSQEDVS